MGRIAVFASGNGTNFQSLVDAQKSNLLAGDITLLISDKPLAFVNTRARYEKIPIFTFDPKQYTNKKEYELDIVKKLDELEIDYIVLAGYMMLIGPTLLKTFNNRIINLHPSLLPSFRGKNAIGQAIAYGTKYTGVTVHFVDEGMDTGPIIKQKVVNIKDDDTLETLTERIHQVEHQLLLESLNLVLSGRLTINGRKVTIKGE